MPAKQKRHSGANFEITIINAKVQRAGDYLIYVEGDLNDQVFIQKLVMEIDSPRWHVARVSSRRGPARQEFQGELAKLPDIIKPIILRYEPGRKRQSESTILRELGHIFFMSHEMNQDYILRPESGDLEIALCATKEIHVSTATEMLMRKVVRLANRTESSGVPRDRQTCRLGGVPPVVCSEVQER